MTGKRGSGILLHITSLPSDNGIGNLGPGAYKFVDFLRDSGQKYWQILPLNPPSPGEGNSPYSSSSAFAGNPLLISHELLMGDGYLCQDDLPPMHHFPPDRVDFASAMEFNKITLDRAYENFKLRYDLGQFQSFCAESRYWLDDFALFRALRAHFGDVDWSEWPAEIRDRQPSALEKLSALLSREIEKEKFVQFLFYSQWNELKRYANENGIEIIGDMPIYLSYQSSDLWAHTEIFKLDQNLKPTFVAGVPPDYFSKTGQLWGNPVYDWNKLEETNFEWWIKRVDHALRFLNILRIDHFRGFVGCWEIPAHEKTAIKGNWIPVPGEKYFAELRHLYPSLPIIAEDLGIITPDVKELIADLDIPGMKVLLFAFGDDLAKNPYAPHNHIKNCVVYTGTHDNNTIRGWYENDASQTEKENLARYTGQIITPDTAGAAIIRMALASVADIVLVPMQDFLGLGSEARMNIPSTPNGNWEWRLKGDALNGRLASQLRSMAHIYGR